MDITEQQEITPVWTSAGGQRTSSNEEDSGGAPENGKRNRYIAKACNECKRRKIKCNGQNPCQRCRRQSAECVYFKKGHGGSDEKNSKDFQRVFALMSSLQEQVTTLNATITILNAQNTTSSDLGRLFLERQLPPGPANHPRPDARSPGRKWSLAWGKCDSFQGPTTSNFSLNVAKSSLKNRGITGLDDPVDEGDLTQEATPVPSPLLTFPSVKVQPLIEPLWLMSKEEGLRLCRVYDEEMGMMYPVLNIEVILNQVHALYAHIEAASLTGVPPDHNEFADTLDDDDINIIKMVFACALTAESSGKSERAMRLFDSTKDGAENYIWGSPRIKGMIFLMLVSIFYFQMDEEAVAWRNIGIVGRMCLEIGLHRRETLQKPRIAAIGPDRAIRLFWSIYVLDMRWSLGTGMPFGLKDTDIDPRLPEPDKETPYLTVMVAYTRIAAKVWNFVAHFNHTNEIKKDEMEYLDWQVLQWIDSIPISLRLANSQTGEGLEHSHRGIRRLQSLLYLRSNQMRMLIYRPILHTAIHVARYPVESNTIVQIAKDTIQFITRLNSTSDAYELQQVTFNWFLISALAVLFLAVAQAPSQFSSQCRDEFYMALELVKDFSTHSYIATRLWKSISSLKRLGPKVGLQKNSGAATENGFTPNRSVVEILAATNPSVPVHGWTPPADVPLGGTQIRAELMSLFEAAGDFGNSTFSNDFQDMSNAGMGEGGYMSSRSEQYQWFAPGEEVSSIMNNCF